MEFIMFPHAGCYNHGCEAIIRATVSMLDASKKDIYLHSSDADNDEIYRMGEICTIVPNMSRDISVSALRYKMFAVKGRLFATNRDIEEICYRYRGLLSGKKNPIAMSIGGDNYCYPGMQHVLSEYMKLFHYKNIPSVLWACSLEQDLLSSRVLEELKRYSLITVRESLSQSYLYENGIIDNVVQCSDPAFLLEPEKTAWPYEELYEEETIGINISPLMTRYENSAGDTYRSVVELIKHILNNTKYNIALIPHVLQTNNSDLTPIYKIQKELNNKRIFVIDSSFNCCQLKSLIAKCSLFIGCRTHATIAAYSSYVPTMVIGYSTKSKGIARDIFGTEEGHVIPVNKIADSDMLIKEFNNLLERAQEEKLFLERRMKEYIPLAFESVNALNKII